VLAWKQLSHGAFRWPPVVDGKRSADTLGFLP
jgi:hypothetical protein